MNRRTSLIAISLAILVAALAFQTFAPSIGHLRASGTPSGVASTGGNGTIQVEGTGEVSVQPDRGIVNIGVTTDATTASAAAQNNANISNAVITALNSIGIDDSNIQTTYYYISPNYSYTSGSSTITGYHVTNEFQVTVIESGQTIQQLGMKIGQVIDTASSNGANQIYGVEFTASSTTIKQAQTSALQDATLDASQKAHTIASALGVTITGVVSVTTTPSYYPEPVYFGVQATATTTPILPPQSLSISATVSVTFSIS